MKVKAAETPTPDVPVVDKLTATASASDASHVTVTFSDVVDKDSITKDSFKCDDTNVSVSGAVLREDGKTVDLTIDGAKENTTYKMTATGIKVGGKVQADVAIEFVTPDAEFKLVLEADKSILSSSSADQTIVRCKVVDNSGNVLKGKKMEVAFSATDGNFADKSVSVKEDGVAENMYTSETFATPKTAYLTATVTESDVPEFRGKTISISVLLTPDADKVDASVGAILTSAEAATADRVIAYFDKEVHAKDFQTDSGYTNTSAFEANVYSGLDNSFNKSGGKTHKVIGVLDVEGANNALQLLVDTPMTDNSNVLVEFTDKRSTSSVIKATNSARFKLTDARQPSMLDVTPKSCRELTVTFSEAVLPRGLAGDSAKQFAADIVANYKIDGRPLSSYGVNDNDKYTTDIDEDQNSEDDLPAVLSEKDTNYDTAEEDGAISVDKFSKGEDKRYIVNIKLGSGHALPSGKHSLQVSNVGDWAAQSDFERNMITTQTFDFEVSADDSAPSFTVDVQSPEQYVVTFSSSVKAVNPEDTIKTPDSSDTTRNIVIELRKYDGKNWVSVSDAAHKSTGDLKNNISVAKAVKKSGEVPDDQYIVEVKNDWTDVYNTKGTNNTYRSDRYALFIGKDKIYNTTNEKKNSSDLVVELNLPRDNASPKIEKAEKALTEAGKETNYYSVKMNEPVKLSAQANSVEGLTASQAQSGYVSSTSGQSGVPTPFAYFEKQEGGKRVDAAINTDAFADAYDTTFFVKPITDLEAGTWDLVVGSISDDIGNTAETLVTPIEITKETVNTAFRVLWAAVSRNVNYNGITSDYGNCIFVKFNKPIALTGGSANALATSNYTLGGATLPQGTDILADIKDYDDHDTVVDSITIRLPQSSDTQKEYLVSGKDAVLNISNFIKSRDGEALSNGGEQKLPFQYGDYEKFNGLTTTGDAVWGNDVTEASELTTINGKKGEIKAKDYYAEFLKALSNEKYREVRLTQNIGSTGDSQAKIMVTRPVDIDLNGCSIWANIEISTTTAVDSMAIKNSSQSTAFIHGGGEKANSTLKLTAPWVKSFTLDERVEVEKGVNDYSIDINGVYPKTFHNKGILNGVVITAANGEVGFKNDGGTVNDKFDIKATATVNLSGNYDSSHFGAGKISVTEATTLNLYDDTGAAINLTGVEIDVTKDTTVNLNTLVEGQPEIIAKNVKLTVNGSDACQTDKVSPKVEGENAKLYEGKDDITSSAAPSDAQKVVNDVVDVISGVAITVGKDAKPADTVHDFSSMVSGVTGVGTDAGKVNVILSTSNEYFEFKDNKLTLKKAYTGKPAKITVVVEEKGGTAKKTIDIKVGLAE